MLSSTLLRHLFGPGKLLLFQLPLRVPEGSKRPNTSPNKRSSPSDDISGLCVDSEDEDSAHDSHAHRADTPEQTKTAEHGAEDVAGFVAPVKGFAVFGSTSAVHTDDVLDHGVDAGSELSAFGNRRNATRSWDLKVSADVDEQELYGERV